MEQRSARQSVTLEIAGSIPVEAAISQQLKVGRGFCFKVFSLVKTSAAADNKSTERSGPRKNPTNRVCNAAGSLHFIWLIGGDG